MDAWKSLIWTAGLRRYLRGHEPSLVHTVSFWAHVCGGAAARLAGVPVVSHFQELVGATSGLGLYRRLIHAWARWVPNRIVCISPRVAEQFDRLPRVRPKTGVILNTVDVEKFAPAPETSQGKLAKDGLRIGTVARLIPWKGQHVALEAAEILKRKIDFEWLFVGGASLGSSAYAQRVKSQARRLGLEEHVEFVDWIEDMPGFYRSLDVLVHVPTEPEPFGLVLGEAMACGVPVVTTAGGGAEELVRAGQGFVVPPGDAEAVASSLLELGESPEDRSARGKEARDLAVQTFSVPQYVSQWQEVYQSVREGASL
jgi:glycosyltransferase involved in cell wall biosynthesis